MKRFFVKVCLPLASIWAAFVFTPQAYLTFAWQRLLPLKVKTLEFAGLAGWGSELQWRGKADSLYGPWSKDLIRDTMGSPEVENVWVIKDLRGRVQVEINRAQPAALLLLDDLYVLGRSGQLLGAAWHRDLSYRKLITLSGPWSNQNDKLRSKHALLVQEGMNVLFRLAIHGLGQDLFSELHFDPQRGWILYDMILRVPIVLGREDIDLKAKRLKFVYADALSKHLPVKRVDLDFEDRAVVKFAASEDRQRRPIWQEETI